MPMPAARLGARFTGLCELRQQLRMTDHSRAGFEIAGDVVEIFRHPLQHLTNVVLCMSLAN